MPDDDPELRDVPLDPPEDQEPEDQEPEDQEPEDQEPEDQEPADQGPADQQPERRPSRGENRFGTLTRELREQREANAALNRRLDALLQAPPRAEQGETLEQRAQRRALMTPEEQMREDLHASEQRHTALLGQMQMQIADATDKAAFDAKATVDPLYQRWAPKVEAKLAELRNHVDPNQRANPSREILMKVLLGEHVLANRKKEVGRQRQEAGRRVANARTRPGDGRSDQQPAGRRGGNESQRREQRLENVNL